LSNAEIERLEVISAQYAKGDLMDDFLVDRETELIRGSCRTFTNAIEVGCGNGYSTQNFRPLFRDYEVLEGSAKNMALMQAKVKVDFPCTQALLEDYKPTRRFDNVLFMNVLEHVDDPIACLKLLEKLLRDEGLLFVSAPNCMSLNRRAGYRMGLLDRYDTLAPKDHALGHRRLYTVDMMRDHCEQAGLKVIAMKGVYLKPLAESQMVGLGLEAVKAFYSLGEDVPEYCANLFAVATRAHY
jgi:2-polyprenyl-3-methyl-5-hydroxy-6-metoxy-1,4-benzoquinol methylase